MQELTNHHLNVSALQFVIFNLFIFCLFIKVANINQGKKYPTIQYYLRTVLAWDITLMESYN